MRQTEVFTAPPSRRHPARHVACAEKLQRRALHSAASPCPAPPRPADRSAATPRCRRRLRASRRAFEIIGPDAPGHVGDADRPGPARAARSARSSDRDRRRGRLRRHRRRRCRNCRSRSSAAHRPRSPPQRAAAEGAAGGPAVARKRPGDFPPVARARGAARSIGRDAGQRAERENRSRDGRPAAHRHVLTAGRRRRAPARSAPGYAGRYWRGRRCRCSRARRSRHCWSGSRPCSGPCRRS